MMRVCWLLLCCIVWPVSAEENHKNDLAEKLIVQINLHKMAESFVGQIENEVQQKSPFYKTSELEKKVSDAMLASYRQTDVKAELHKYIVRNYSLSELEDISRWLETPLGKKILKSEIEAGKPGEVAKQREFAAGLKSNPPDKKRVDVMQDLEQATRLSTILADQMVILIIGVASGFNEMAPASRKLSSEDFRAKANSTVPMIKPLTEAMLRQHLITTAHYTYQGFSVEEIRQYVEFVRSETGVKYIDLIKAVNYVFQKITDNAINKLKVAQVQ